MNALQQFRESKDDEFRNPDTSPLEQSQIRKFLGLDYYPENSNLRVEIPLNRYPNAQVITLTTSTGDNREYYRVGEARFTYAETECVLHIYEDDYGFFVPFTDLTAPSETYGGGRYLEPHEVRSNVLYVDFNLAYNPYCAYNDKWSCPLPPAENALPVRIDAGEKNFPYSV